MFARKQKFENVTIFWMAHPSSSATSRTALSSTVDFCQRPLTLVPSITVDGSSVGRQQNTMGFMADLYRAGAQELIEATFDNIRGKPNPAAVITGIPNR